LHVDRANGNQGAESTLAFLLSLVEMRQAQNMLTSFRQPITSEDYPSLPQKLKPDVVAINYGSAKVVP